MTDRITRAQMFMDIAQTVAKRSTCTRKQVGSVIVRNGRVISMGYAGAPAGMPHCTEIGCLANGIGGGCTNTVHAEANAIAFAAREGIAVKGATLYTTLSPCLTCAKLIVNAGIQYVIFAEPYRDLTGLDLLAEAGVMVERYG